MSIKINKLKSSTKVNAGYCRRMTAGNVVEYTTMVKRPTARRCLNLTKTTMSIPVPESLPKVSAHTEPLREYRKPFEDLQKDTCSCQC